MNIYFLAKSLKMLSVFVWYPFKVIFGHLKFLDFSKFWKKSRKFFSKFSKIFFPNFLKKLMMNDYLGFSIPPLVSVFVTTRSNSVKENFWRNFRELPKPSTPLNYQKNFFFDLHSFFNHNLNNLWEFQNFNSEEDKVKKLTFKTLSIHNPLKIIKKKFSKNILGLFDIKPKSAQKVFS